MPRPKGVTQLELLRRKQAEITEQLKAAEAKERERDKQSDARRREILGTLLSEHMMTEPRSAFVKTLLELLAGKLTRPTDRALFPGLGPISTSTKAAKKARIADAQHPGLPQSADAQP